MADPVTLRFGLRDAGTYTPARTLLVGEPLWHPLTNSMWAGNGSTAGGIRVGGAGGYATSKRVVIGASPYTLLTTEEAIFCVTDGGAITINLPAGIHNTQYRIINTGSSGNAVILTPNGAELLTGANASRTLSDSSVIILVYETTEGWW